MGNVNIPGPVEQQPFTIYASSRCADNKVRVRVFDGERWCDGEVETVSALRMALTIYEAAIAVTRYQNDEADRRARADTEGFGRG